MSGRAPDQAPTLWLASASPRRRALLAAAGLRFEVRPADVEERVDEAEGPRGTAERLARLKAEAVAERLASEGRAGLVLGADTVVAMQQRVLGKPANRQAAAAMLWDLSGRTHQVWTGVAVVGVGSGAGTEVLESFVVCSAVRFAPLTESLVAAYVDSGEGLDKAGGYAIQGRLGRRLVVGFQGSFSNVVGLPLAETLAALARHGLRAPHDAVEVERAVQREAGW